MSKGWGKRKANENSKKHKLVKNLTDTEVEQIISVVGDVPFSLLVAMKLEGMTNKEIAQKTGYGLDTIKIRLANWSLYKLNYWKKHRADILAAGNEKAFNKVLDIIDKGDYELKDVANCFAKLYDRERVERGLGFGNKVIDPKALDARQKEIEEERKKLQAELEKEGKVKRLKTK